MKRALVAALLTVVFAACEDGPKQTFVSAPPGADKQWNDGKTPSVTDPNVTQGFGTQSSGTNAMEICDAPTKMQRWSMAFTQPILPPRKGGGLDMAGGDTWQGLTMTAAEQALCQSYNLDVGLNYWGDNDEIVVWYFTNTRKIWQLSFFPGYTGALTWHSRDMAHQYKLVPNQQISKDGHPMTIDWGSGAKVCSTTPCDWAVELADGWLATFQPGLPADTDCRQNAHCIINNIGDSAYFWVPATGCAIWNDNYHAQQPVPSTFTRIDVELEKVLPFSTANSFLKLDGEGPTAVSTGLGPMNKTCTMKMGMTYGDLLTDCVQVSGVAQTDTDATNELLGGLTHGDERFHFDIAGIDVNMSDKTLDPMNVIRDSDRPSMDDVATEWDVDQETLGKVLNDRVGNTPTGALDLHMTGLIYAEFLRQVQDAVNGANVLNGLPQHQIGDAACLPGAAKFGLPAASGGPAAGCSGFEGFYLPVAPALIDDVELVKAAGGVPPTTGSPLSSMVAGMKPGNQKVAFCDGPAQTDCNTVGGTFAFSYNRLVAVWGKGSNVKLPPEMKDQRFMWRAWSVAFFKYLLAEGAKPGNVKYSDVHDTANVNGFHFDDLFFDSLGGQFEIAEYIDRRSVSATQDPTDIVITADVIDDIVNDYEFSRDILRGETAIYMASVNTLGDPPGKDPALASNVFGAPALLNGWKDETLLDGSGTRTAYQCATDDMWVNDTHHCQTPPPMDVNTGGFLRDEHGRMILLPYKGSFSKTGTVFHLGPSTNSSGQPAPSPVHVAMPTAATDAIQSIRIDVPLHVDSYDTTSAFVNPQKPYSSFLVPYLPKQPGVGFPIALSGTRDKFVTTGQIDLTGTTISANIDYDVFDPTVDQSINVVLKAVETTDFLGYVFLCVDPKTQDTLAVKMYTPAANVLDWINKHPNTVDDCGLIVRFSPYNNFPDYITSLTNGVRLGITQGGGFGRVVDVTLFAPGQ